MWEKIKRSWQQRQQIAVIFVFMLLFPYVMALLFCNSWQWFETPMKQQTEERYVVVRGEIITVEEYVEGVLPGVLCSSLEPELMKCMAIILRTDVYAVMGEQLRIEEEELPFTYLVGEQVRGLPVFSDDSGVYVSYEEYVRQIELAVEQTCGQVYEIEGEVTFLPFCVASNGKTRYRPGVTKSVESPADLQADGAVWCISYAPKELLSRMLEAGWLTQEEYEQCQSVGEAECVLGGDFTVEYDSNGYVTEVIYKERIKIEGSVFADTMSLPSESFWIQDYKESLRFVGSGIGSGYGLCIYQADMMAKQGASFGELLSYYYCK